MKVSEELKDSIDKKRYRTRIIEGEGEQGKVIEVRPFSFAKFIISMSKIILENLNQSTATKERAAYEDWMKVLNGENESEHKELLSQIYNFLNYYLRLDTEIFGDSEEEIDWKGFSSPRNVSIAWSDYTSLKIKNKERLIESAEEPETEKIKPVWGKLGRYDHAPFCPKCSSLVAMELNMPPGSTHYDLVWIYPDQTPVYNYCPKCGQKLDWGDPEPPIEKTRIIFGKTGSGMSFTEKLKALGEKK